MCSPIEALRPTSRKSPDIQTPPDAFRRCSKLSLPTLIAVLLSMCHQPLQAMLDGFFASVSDPACPRVRSLNGPVPEREISGICLRLSCSYMFTGHSPAIRCTQATNIFAT